MENRIIVFSNDVANVKKIMCKLGCFDALISCNRFDDCLENCRKARECERAVVICENNQIDKLVDEIKEADDTFELIEEQALVVNTPVGKILFLPCELDAYHFLSQFLEQNEVFASTIFGKSRNSIKTVFDGLKAEHDLSYEIITKSQFLHTVYYSKEVENLEQTFGENLLSFCDEEIASALSRVCGGKNLGVCEQYTSGLLTCKLKREANASLNESVLILNDNDLLRNGVSQSTIDEKGVVSKEVAFNLAKNLAKKCDVALVALAGDEGKGFVAVGNTDEIHVFSVVFEKENFLQNFVDFALFRLLKYLS